MTTYIWPEGSGGAGGIDELTGDVTAGPGSGSQPATVEGIQGTPVSSTAPAAGEVLAFDGAQWAPTVPTDTGITELTGDVTAGPGSGSQAATVAALQGNPVSSVAPTDGQVLTWNGSAWVPGAPAAGGSGGGGQVYFLNAPSGQVPVTGLPLGVRELGLVADVGLTTVTSAALPTGGVYAFVAGFVTAVGAPGLDAVPAGLWDFNVWATTNVAQPNATLFRVNVYKYDGAVATPLGTSAPVALYDPTQTIQYLAAVALPQTTLLTTDRIYVEIEGTGTSPGHTLTVSLGDAAPSHVHTTLPSIAGTGIVHVINGVVQSPASPVDLTAGATEISGTLPIGNGGTGLATTPTDGQLLIGQTATNDYALATLTAGTNITITNAAGSITIDAAGGGGAVFAGALTVYVDPVNGTDAPGGGTLGAPYASINYAYSQVSSLGDVTNTVYNANVEQFVVEKLIFQLAPGRYVENVLLGFKRARVQLVGNGVKIIGSVTMRAVRADFPAANMEALKTSFPAPYTGAGMLATFEITGQAGGGVEADATADPLVVTGLSTLLFDEPTVPGLIASGTAWDNNYGQFNFYANKAYLIGGMVYSTSYVTTPFRGLGTSVIEVDSSTIGEASIPYRSYLGAVPYAYAANPTLWNTGTGVATGAQTSTTLQDTTKAWTVNQWVGATVLLTSGTGAAQTRTVISNTATALTVAAWATTPVAASTVYSLIGAAGTATGVQSSTTLQDTSKTWAVNQYAGAQITLTGGTGAPQTRIIASNTADTLTVSSAWTTTPVSGSTTYSVAYNVAEGVITAKVHNSTLGASVGPRITLGELDGCRIYDLDRTMLGTVGNGGVTGSISSSYMGSVVNQYRQFSGTGIPASQYQLGSALSGTRYKFDSTSYTTIAFNRSSTTGVLTARTLNSPTDSGTATAGAATTLTDTSKVWTTNRWSGGTITLTGGTGSGQTRTISSNTATAITVSPAWTTNPAAGTTYTVTALVAFDFQDDARSLAYTPTAPLNWVDPDPSTVGSALDKVATLGLLAAAPANGQIPIGNGTNFTPATLTAGSGITVTNGAGTVTIAATGGGTVTAVTATAPINSTGGATPNISLTGTVGVANGGTGLSATPANGQIPLGNGSGYTLGTLTAGAGITITNASGAVTVAADANAPRMISLDGTATGNAATIIGSVYFPANTNLTTAATAYIGGAVVADSTSLTLVPIGGGVPAATWTRSGTLGTQALGAGVTVPAGWYDITLQETVIPPTGSGTAFARGLYLA